MDTIEKARKLRNKIEEIAKTIPDDIVADYAELFPKWNGNDSPYSLGERVFIGDSVYKCLQSHNSKASLCPTNAPSLWCKVLAEQGNSKADEVVKEL